MMRLAGSIAACAAAFAFVAQPALAQGSSKFERTEPASPKPQPTPREKVRPKQPPSDIGIVGKWCAGDLTLTATSSSVSVQGRDAWEGEYPGTGGCTASQGASKRWKMVRCDRELRYVRANEVAFSKVHTQSLTFTSTTAFRTDTTVCNDEDQYSFTLKLTSPQSASLTLVRRSRRFGDDCSYEGQPKQDQFAMSRCK
jgi:hypothetical protein